MSGLENAVKPFLDSMVHGEPKRLDADQQTQLSLWTMKTVMVLEGVRRKTNCFYTQQEREDLHKTSLIPVNTLIWLGCFEEYGINTVGTDTPLEPTSGFPQTKRLNVTTLLFGRLVIQSLGVRLEPEGGNVGISGVAGGKPGLWPNLLTQIFPLGGSTHWPPDLTFTNGGARPYWGLVRRWTS
jgi:hypothetical protein